MRKDGLWTLILTRQIEVKRYTESQQAANLMSSRKYMAKRAGLISQVNNTANRHKV